MPLMHSLEPDYRAVVFGSTGGIGKAFVEHLRSDPACGEVIGLSRSSSPAIDLGDEATIAEAAAAIRGDVDLLIDATGFLHDQTVGPEKSLRMIEPEAMARLFALNTIGPALLIKHFHARMPRDRRSVFALLSARVGSIGDNRLGGWYGYRASKAAQNMIVRSAAVEVARNRPQAVFASLHPGTVATSLSEPFSTAKEKFSPRDAAARLLKVLDGLSATESGGFWDYGGNRIEW